MVFTFSSQTESGPSTSTSKLEPLSKCIPRPSPALAGACDLMDIKTLLKEWVTTITGTQKRFHCDASIGAAENLFIYSLPTRLLEPMEEDILQVVKYCTDLIDDKDLEKLDLIIKYMKR